MSSWAGSRFRRKEYVRENRTGSCRITTPSLGENPQQFSYNPRNIKMVDEGDTENLHPPIHRGGPYRKLIQLEPRLQVGIT
jgi:hypothetical protein